MKKFWWIMGIALVALTTLLMSCQGAAGPAGTPGAPGKSSGTISGKITSSLNQKPVAGAAVTTDPAIKEVTITSGADGSYTGELPIGTYKLTFKKDNFTSATETVVLVAGQTVTKDVVLKPVSAVIANAGKDQEAEPGKSITLKASAESLDGSTVTGYKWTQIAGASAKISNPDSDTITVTLGDANAYKTALLSALNLPERSGVQAINPHALEAAETATFKVTVATATGNYSDTVNVITSLPYVINGGLANVPIGLPVLVHGKTQRAPAVLAYGGSREYYQWALTTPHDSKAALDNPSDQNPAFTPDTAGKYTLKERVSGFSIDIYAGTWAGAISGLDAKGRPLSAGCTVCHNGKQAPDKFTDWKASGHAEIFTQNIDNPAGHWTESCATCHTVGYSPNAKNNGFDEAMAAEGWKVPPHGEVGYYANMLKQFPKTASLANIQCENCHGPNNSPLHANGTIDASRVSLSADACGACHGEPLRHGRFQQWEESGHSGIESSTTPERATSSSCARCHSAQGFLLWLKQGDLMKQIQGKNGNATADEMTAMGFTVDKLEPVTCVVCHDPHKQGTTSGEPNTATVRIIGDTMKLPAGFQAKEVGKGALCMTCHNTRNDVHNVDAPPTSYSAPHVAAQADVLMGENAYFVGTSQRSPHSYIKDTCVTCHMEETPPPAEFSYQQSGTNHSFSASTEICESCHSDALKAEAMQVGTEDKLEKLGVQMSTYLLKKIPAKVTVKDYTAHDYKGVSVDFLSDGAEITKDNIAAMEPTEPHGQQGFIIKFKNPVTFTYKPTNVEAHTVSLTEAEVRLGDITTDGTTTVVAATDNLVKAGWNYFLIHGDSSKGIHNPAFVNAVLDASIAVLK
ncbi:MAG: carboxypeptidase regulatory-like domain-containing protein [Chloroflexi bacterium]|nr:carboxypeptidase regulatory-like domain-containing protein [Chloroflexota bacterium]